MELGYLTPPVGMNLFFTAYRFGKPLPEVFRAALPAFCVLAIGLVAVTEILAGVPTGKAVAANGLRRRSVSKNRRFKAMRLQTAWTAGPWPT